MSSELKIEANRRNAQLCTGPKAPEGKAKAATNSCTHGLCSRNAILPEEDPAEFQALLAGLLSEFQPANAREESHVRELASAEWRLRRIVRLETGIFVSAMEKVREWEKCRNTAPSPRIAKMTKQSQTPAPPDPQPRDCLGRPPWGRLRLSPVAL
jgi:hypothetical protein